MKKLTTKVLSFILTLSMMFSLMVPAFAAENYDSEGTLSNTQESIDAAREAYAALTPEAKAIFDASLTYDTEMLKFHTTYVDQNFTPPAPRPQTRSAAAVADPMRVLMVELGGLGLPSAVLYSLKAMGAGMVAAIADGPLPVGDILLAAATASAVVVIAANWDVVSPKFNQITRAFEKAFSTAASNISSAFSKIKSDAKKEVDKNKAKEKKPTGNRVKDVQNRLKKEGFKKTGQTGSHEKWKKGNKTVTVPNHGSNYEIPIGTLRNIWKQAGWI
ncbi:MAG TPA: type II toxin-antitoxin system HicA family toxin [Candidatus Agathobaculum pullicola]|nr:type II toxin-antitoxin system HicA family toxin [Candidatus Agathobaculum pullicola]